MSTKICNNCKEEKSISEFSTHQGKCKLCRSKIRVQIYHEKHEKHGNIPKAEPKKCTKSVTCPCGAIVNARGINGHRNSNKHIENLLLSKYYFDTYDYDDFNYPLHILEKFF